MFMCMRLCIWGLNVLVVKSLFGVRGMASGLELTRLVPYLHFLFLLWSWRGANLVANVKLRGYERSWVGARVVLPAHTSTPATG